MAMASTVTAASSFHLAFPLLSVLSSSSSSNTLHFPLRHRHAYHPLAITAFKKLSEASLVPIPREPTQPLVDEDALPSKLGVLQRIRPRRGATVRWDFAQR
jgi:hypothetical protein